MTLSLQRTNPVMYLILLALAVVVLYSASNHAKQRHGETLADTIYNTCQHNSLGSYRRAKDNRIANICQLEDGSFAVRIDENGHNVSDFVIDNAKTLQDAIRYVQESKFMRWIGIGVFQ